MPVLRESRPDADTIASFYDETLEQRLRDYVFGNDRIAAAVALSASLLDRSVTKVLEVGCGLGISAAELARGRDWLTVHAVDISPKTIAAAGQLFAGNDRLIFEVSDLREVPRLAPYDLITMLDVYEHIPRSDWPAFNARIASALSRDGAIVVTVPSPWHQEYLARENPAGLQIVDETVRVEDLAALARDVDGHIMKLNVISIWNDNDYIHAVIRRNPLYRPLRWVRPEGVMRRIAGRISAWRSSATRRRIAAIRSQQVYERLGVQVETAP
jgi:2-polyprenyl-3-methyl-5-hydroxy-6-metoxy-1,4-benzoquinol methylase